jgi:hypothetical protein
MNKKTKEELIDIASVIFGVIGIIAFSFWAVTSGQDAIADYFRSLCYSRIHPMCFMNI